jgi:uncharacterized protein YjeT (DUF2065 family)
MMVIISVLQMYYPEPKKRLVQRLLVLSSNSFRLKKNIHLYLSNNKKIYT